MVFLAGPCSRVFWDVEDFPFPNGVVPDLIYQNMKKILESKGFFGELSIMAYVNKENFADELLDVYDKAGITIIHHPHQGELTMYLMLLFFLNLFYICL